MSGADLGIAALRVLAPVLAILIVAAVLFLVAGVLAQAWRGGGRQARIARLLRASNTSVVPLDAKMALRVGARCAATRTARSPMRATSRWGW